MPGIKVDVDKIYIEEKTNKACLIGIIKYTILISWGLTTIIPLLWVFMNSFKSTSDILTNAIGFPKSINFINFESLGRYSDVNIFRGFLNSGIISGSVVLLISLLGGMAGFAISRFRFRQSKYVKLFFFCGMLVPQFAVILPNFIIVQKLKLNGTYLAIILPQTAAFLSFTILMLAGFMETQPVELEEAAIIDGSSIPGIFFRITLPLSVPAFATMGIMVFLWSYNDLLLSLVYLPRQLQPVCVLLSLVSSIFGTDYGALMAAVTITIVPVLILYIISQEYVIKGLTAGALKG